MTGSVPWGEFRGRAPHGTACDSPNENCSPPSGDFAPKKVKGLVPLKCSLRPETAKFFVAIQEFVSKNCFFANSALKTLFCGFTPEIVDICVFFEMKTFFFFCFF